VLNLRLKMQAISRLILADEQFINEYEWTIMRIMSFESDHFLQSMQEFARLQEPRINAELAEHYGSIKYTDLSDSITRVAAETFKEIVEPGSYTSQTDDPNTVTVATANHVGVANLQSGDKQILSPKEFIGDSSSPIGKVAMLANGQYVASNRDGELFAGTLGSEDGVERIGKAYVHQFGILSSGSIVVLDDERRVRVDGKLSDVVTPDIVRKRLFKAPIRTQVKADKLEVVGDQVLVEKTIADQTHAEDLLYAKNTIFVSSGGFERSDFYWQQWTNMAHFVMRLRSDGIDLVPVLKFEQSNITGLSEIIESGCHEKSADQMCKSSDNASIHSGSITAKTTDHRIVEPDIWLPRWDWPRYERTDFYQGDSHLGSVRVDKHAIARSAIAGALNGSIGYVGKRDGTVEVVDFSNNRSAMIGLTHTGDYQHRLPPKYIAQWKAHEKPLKRIFALTNGNVVTVDVDGNAAQWAHNK
jgi:hypothetical protein